MEVKAAIERAKEYVRDLFAPDGAFNFGLEEVRYDDHDGTWEITIGFSRGWDRPGVLETAIGTNKPTRTFKTVEIRDKDEKVLGVRHWPLAA